MRRGRPKLFWPTRYRPAGGAGWMPERTAVAGGPQTAVRRSQVADRRLQFAVRRSRRFMVYKQPLRSFGPSLLAGEAYTKGCLCFVIIYH